MRVWGMHERTQIKLSATDRAALKAVVANRNSPQKHVWRAKIVLLTAAGHGTAEIMRRTGKAKTVIWRWQERFGSEGAAGLWRDKTRPSRIPPLSPDIAERVVALTLAGPPAHATHWTGAAMAKAVGISVSSVQRIWRAHGLQPHRMRQFKLSNDPQFVAKLRDIVDGMARSPPALCLPLHPDLGILAQCCRRSVRAPGQATPQARRVSFAQGTHGRNPQLHRRYQCQPKAIYLDKRPWQDHRRRQTRAPSVRH